MTTSEERSILISQAVILDIVEVIWDECTKVVRIVATALLEGRRVCALSLQLYVSTISQLI